MFSMFLNSEERVVYYYKLFMIPLVSFFIFKLQLLDFKITVGLVEYVCRSASDALSSLRLKEKHHNILFNMDDLLVCFSFSLRFFTLCSNMYLFLDLLKQNLLYNYLLLLTKIVKLIYLHIYMLASTDDPLTVSHRQKHLLLHFKSIYVKIVDLHH